MFFIWTALLIFLVVVFGLSYVLLAELWRITVLDGVPAVSSTWAIVDRVIVERVFPRDGLILDLGCGNGWTMRRFWRSGIRGPLVGYELAFLPWITGVCWNVVTRMPITIHRKDLLHAPLEDAKGLYLFLLPRVLAQIAPELKRRVQPGTIIVSAEFALPGWEPTKVFEARGVTRRNAKIYCYVV